MGRQGDAEAPRKEEMKKLRELRRSTIDQAAARMKEQKKIIDSIKAELLKGDKTVPQVAAATGIPSASVLWTIAALKKYGQVTEGDADGSYIRYQLAESLKAGRPETVRGASDES